MTVFHSSVLFRADVSVNVLKHYDGVSVYSGVAKVGLGFKTPLAGLPIFLNFLLRIIIIRWVEGSQNSATNLTKQNNM